MVSFIDSTPDEELFLPVQVIGEIRAGIMKLRRRNTGNDAQRAQMYEDWLEGDLLVNYPERILEFDIDSAQIWGAMLSGQKNDPNTIDKQIAAIASTRSMTVVTRDRGQAFSTIQASSGNAFSVLNPFT